MVVRLTRLRCRSDNGESRRLCHGRRVHPAKRAVWKRVRIFAADGAMKKAGAFSAGLYPLATSWRVVVAISSCKVLRPTLR